LWDYNLLRQFGALDKLIVERPVKGTAEGCFGVSGQEFAICLKTLTDFFDREKGKDQHFKIPQIIGRDWTICSGS
jgi:hypothetical protein